ncbi:FtsW/RodA/SpoVE family cell cycle protein [Nonomuraea gerenzanensis]|uniref:Uncharacterized protein n=1 Tax=Nonomuraea gerenzanensis TaxID=93944 RepID=A0A1M4E262_9ACTN|nr:FtsW/RodA/SpoVE family cell cycle protein [Nonomuraea gerenzanensis]UBU15178.1 FtsW/RodA/SpoVE family cell cycle protein [Nonomuraea gerenzanensis]SBO92920.1 hypothetical protein BN4615_P2434 [Nonomuraea gerenzanensis]
MLLGTTANGAQSWLSLGGLDLQRSEPAKAMPAPLLGDRVVQGTRGTALAAVEC